MGYVVYIAIGAWSIFVIALFLTIPVRRAMLAAFVVGVLFLPIAGLPLTGLRSKLMIVCAVVGTAAMLISPGRILRIRPRLFDLPAAVWCTWPIASSLANGLGPYDGVSAALENFICYGIPYLLGRAYCADLAGLRELALSIFLGGLAYVPFCLWEVRFSPQLHRLVYGFHQHSFVQTLRFGGFRPVVFMDHGLMVAMWMTAASLVAFWLWRTRSTHLIFGVPTGAWVVVLICTTVLCKSAGALVLLGIGIGLTLLSGRVRTRIPVAVLLMIPAAYLCVRVGGRWSEQPVLELARDAYGDERSQSLEFRFRNEELLLSRALEKRLTGWGRWGRFLVIDPESGKSFTVPDALWIVALGEYGLVGLSAITSMLLLPGFLFLRRFRVADWHTPELAPAAALALLLALYMIDNLANAMINPLYFLSAGGLSGLRLRRVSSAHAAVPPDARGRIETAPRASPAAAANSYGS